MTPLRPRTIFYGTPEVSVKSLRALAETSEIVGVICQPDRPSGRGLGKRPPPIKETATELGLPLFQPEKVKDGALLRFVQEARADVAVVIAYGRIIPLDVLEAPRMGSVNLHASLLPALRGAAPIQRALMAGLPRTGVCLMRMEAGLDTGPVLSRHELDIAADEDAGQLTLRIADLAAEIVRTDLPRYLSGELTPEPQNDLEATYALPIGPSDAALDVTLSALELHNRVRGLAPRPGAHFMLQRASGPQRLKVLKARIHPSQGLTEGEAPGTVVLVDGQPLIETGAGRLEIVLGQLEGKRAQMGRDLVNGRILLAGDRVS